MGYYFWVFLLLSLVQVFMINLQKRTDRRERMLRALYEQEIACKVIAAVDGKYVCSFKLFVDVAVPFVTGLVLLVIHLFCYTISEQWISVKFMIWASTCYLDTVTHIMVAHWQKESLDVSSLTIKSGKRWALVDSQDVFLSFVCLQSLMNWTVSGCRLWSGALKLPWSLRTTCGLRSSSNGDWWT